MSHRAIAVIVVGTLASVAGCKDDGPRKVAPTQTPRLPPVGGWDAVPSGAGPGLPAVADAARGGGSGSAVASGSGTGTGSAVAAGSGSGSGRGTGSGSGSGTGTGSTVAGAAPDCDVTIAVTPTRAEWTGGAKGSAAITRGNLDARALTQALAKLDDTACRILIRPDEAVRHGTIIEAMEAVVAERSFRIAIIIPSGTQLLATPPSSGAAGTAVRDARAIAIGKRDIRVGDQVAATVADPDIAGKVSQALSAMQAGNRGIMVIVRVGDATPFKVIGAVLTGAKNSGFDSVVFLRG